MARVISIGSGLPTRNQVIEQTPSSLVMLFGQLCCVNKSLQAGGASLWFEPEGSKESNTMWLDSGLT